MKTNKYIALCFAAALSIGAWAVPATPNPISITLADGNSVTLRLMGDENFSYYTTLSGQPVRIENGKLVNITDIEMEIAQNRPAIKQARRVAQEATMASTYPLTGSPKSLVILVNYTDLKFVTSNPKEAYTRLLNESGYSENDGIGSARDYFIANSDSIFSPQFDVYGPYDLAHDMKYYGGGSADAHAGDMIFEAVQLAYENGVDIKQYDTDGDNYLDNVFVYYPGHNPAEGGSADNIWPHRSVVGNSSAIVDGKRVYDYACTSELRGTSGTSMCGIGTFCHEFGHVLGLPDFYNTQNSSAYTVGSWDIMCSGSYNGNGKKPIAYSSYERFFLGWLVPEQLEEAGYHTLEPLETSHKAYLIAGSKHNMIGSSPSPTEFFMLENRQHVGWDAADETLPYTGMLIWHIDYSSQAWTQNFPNNGNPLRYHLVPSYGTPTRSTGAEAFPGTYNVTTCDPELHNGTSLEQPLLDIAQAGQLITFAFKSMGAQDLEFFPGAVPEMVTTYDYSRHPTQQIEVMDSVTITGSMLDPNVAVTITTNNKFQFSLNGEVWTNSKEFKTVKADSSFSQKLYLRYWPGKMVCTTQKGLLTATQGALVRTLDLTGSAPRPTYIDTPVWKQPEQITPYSFNLVWETQSDAEQYFITLYHIEDVAKEYVQSFENFDDPLKIEEEGWTSTVSEISSGQKVDGQKALLFNAEEYIISPDYLSPVTNLSFWVTALSSTDNAVGVFYVYATNSSDSIFHLVDSVSISKTTKKYTAEFEYSLEDNYTRFKISYQPYGGNGAVLDLFKATSAKSIIYEYSGRELTINAPEDEEELADSTSTTIGGLKPATQYFATIRSWENKGCEEHLSGVSETIAITTAEGSNDTKHLVMALNGTDPLTYQPATHVLYLPETENGAVLNIFDAVGRLVWTYNVQEGISVVALPTNQFYAGAVYIAKYMPAGKMSGKQKWLKFVALTTVTK